MKIRTSSADRLHRADHGGPRDSGFRADDRRHQHRPAEPRAQQSRQRLCRLRQLSRPVRRSALSQFRSGSRSNGRSSPSSPRWRSRFRLAVLMFEATPPNVRNALCVLFIVPVLLPRVSAAFVWRFAFHPLFGLAVYPLQADHRPSGSTCSPTRTPRCWQSRRRRLAMGPVLLGRHRQASGNAAAAAARSGAPRSCADAGRSTPMSRCRCCAAR